MHSALPKVLQPLAGRPLLEHVVRAARALEPAGIHIVYGHGAEQVRAAFADQPDLHWALQAEQLGTGHAVLQAMPAIPDDHQVLIMFGDVPLIVEGYVDFEREVSIVGVRSTAGEVRAYPIVANTHKHGILRVTLAPHRHPVLQKAAEIYLKRVLRHFAYAGVLTIEFFVRKGRLVANEMAPRVHNSGHWTIEGAATSQFENHLRAILGLPLGDTSPVGHCAMINFIGTMPERDAILALPGVHWHDYGKEPRPGRKIGHCTVVAASAVERDRLVRKVMRKMPPR